MSETILPSPATGTLAPLTQELPLGEELSLEARVLRIEAAHSDVLELVLLRAEAKNSLRRIASEIQDLRSDRRRFEVQAVALEACAEIEREACDSWIQEITQGVRLIAHEAMVRVEEGIAEITAIATKRLDEPFEEWMAGPSLHTLDTVLGTCSELSQQALKQRDVAGRCGDPLTSSSAASATPLTSTSAASAAVTQSCTTPEFPDAPPSIAMRSASLPSLPSANIAQPAELANGSTPEVDVLTSLEQLFKENRRLEEQQQRLLQQRRKQRQAGSRSSATVSPVRSRCVNPAG